MSAASGSSAAAQPRANALRRRGVVVLATVAAALAAFGSTTQAWLSVTLPQTAVQSPSITIPGSDAATSVTAFALVGLAAGLAASIAGRTARWLIALILTVAGIGIVWSSLAVLTDPVSSAAPAVAEALGVTSQEGVSVSVGSMPWLAVIAGLFLVLCAVWLLIAGRGWRAARRYEKTPGQTASETPVKRDSNADEIDSWDSLSRGEDPTG